MERGKIAIGFAIALLCCILIVNLVSMTLSRNRDTAESRSECIPSFVFVDGPLSSIGGASNVVEELGMPPTSEWEKGSSVTTSFLRSRVRLAVTISAPETQPQLPDSLVGWIVESWAWMFDSPRFVLRWGSGGFSSTPSKSWKSNSVVRITTASATNTAAQIHEYLRWECGNEAKDWTLIVSQDSFVVAHRLAWLLLAVNVSAATSRIPGSIVIGGTGLQPASGIAISRLAMSAICSSIKSNQRAPSQTGSILEFFRNATRQVTVVEDSVHFSPTDVRSQSTREIFSTVAIFGGLGLKEPMLSAGVLSYEILRLHTLGPRTLLVS